MPSGCLQRGQRFVAVGYWNNRQLGLGQETTSRRGGRVIFKMAPIKKPTRWPSIANHGIEVIEGQRWMLGRDESGAAR